MNNRILILSNSIGGLFGFRKEVIKELLNEGFQVHISCPINDEVYEAEWFSNNGCSVIDTRFNRQGTNPIKDIKLMLFYFRLIKKIQPAVVLSYTIKPNLYGGMACSLCKVPQIANITGLGAAVEYPGFMQKITIALYRICLHNTYLTFFQNEENQQFCKANRMVRGKQLLIPGSGVNINYHELKEYPKMCEPIRFLFCSRVRKEKGIDQYISAAYAITSKYPDVEFHIIGGCEGDYEKQLADLSNKGIVFYHGKQSDVRPFYSMANCTVHPTYYPEGMSNVLLESCSTGRPIITTDRAGCREIVRDGINGFIVKPRNPEDLIQKIEQFIELPYEKKKQMGLEARKLVENEFDRKIVIKAYLNAIKNLCQYD